MNPRSLINWFMSPSFDYYNMSQHDIRNVASMICNEWLRQKPKRFFNSNDYIYINSNKIDPQAYEKSNFLRPVFEILDTLSKDNSTFIEHFLLHGSLADLKYIKGLSDLDTWVVVSDRVFESARCLIELKDLFFRLNMYLLRIDSIAHHGFIIVLRSDLDDYNNSLMPVEVIREARSLYGSSDIYIRKSNATFDWVKKFQEIKNTFIEFNTSGVFKHHPYKGEYLTKDMIKQHNGMYQLKYLIGLATYLPSAYYTAIGKSVYKSKSFEPFSKTFLNSLIVNIISEIRTNWEKMEQYPYTPNKIPSWLIDMLPHNYVEMIIQLLDDIIKDIQKTT